MHYNIIIEKSKNNLLLVSKRKKWDERKSENKIDW